MDRKSWMIFACVACVCGCSEGNEPSESGQCHPACGVGEHCVSGICEPSEQVCEPSCELNERCVDGECVPVVGSKVCVPSCAYHEECVDGECVDASCSGAVCRDEHTYCGPNGVWATCLEGSTCLNGNCVIVSQPECEAGTCSEDGQFQCVDGQWEICGAFEACFESSGKCEILPIDCEPGTCSSGGEYACKADRRYEKCVDGETCVNGECVSSHSDSVTTFWKVCASDSQCVESGICLRYLSLSRSLSDSFFGLSNVDRVPVWELDSRIPYGYGVCSSDCTKSEKVCAALGKKPDDFVCQLLIVGEIAYPPVDSSGEPLSLPFSDVLNISDMALSPFGALCRPSHGEGDFYSETALTSCYVDRDCSASEVCLNGACLPVCEDSSGCPIGFACERYWGDGVETDKSLCMPSSGTLSACLDTDGDGQGWGHCAKSGVDCNSEDSNIYYSESLPQVCSYGMVDMNCNGKVDSYELLGSSEHCRYCDDFCQLPETAEHRTRECRLYSDKILDEHSYAMIHPSEPSTYLSYCYDACEDGWADCNGNPSDGCEVQLVSFNDGKAFATSQADVYSRDYDGDGHGVPDARYYQYCCQGTNQCFALPNTYYNSTGVWSTAVNPDFILSSDGITKQPLKPSRVIDDCDDVRAERHPGLKEVCDGIDNDCNAQTQDGASDTFDGKSLGSRCRVMNGEAICSEDGKVICDVSHEKLVCFHETSSYVMDNNCDGIDDDCDGLVDEDYQAVGCFVDSVTPVSGVTNICSYGVTQCKSGKSECIPIYTAREYDFYGDGIDSNCDGYDYDIKNAVFVRKYSKYGSAMGNDEHTGKYDSPVSTLDKAISLACGSFSNYCYDIIIDKEVGQDLESGDRWGEDLIRVPGYGLPWSVSLESAPSQISDLYLSCYSTGCGNNRLFPGEVYVPREAVRIYGGFTVGIDSVWTKTEEKSLYKYKLHEASHRSPVLIKALDGTLSPLSLRIENMLFEFDGSGLESRYQTGMTMTGLTCGTAGCRDLALVNTELIVKGSSGWDRSKDSHKSNDIWGSYINGVDANHEWLNSSSSETSKQSFSMNHDVNACFSGSYIAASSSTGYGAGWQMTPNSVYQAVCPDGMSPRGGAPGAYCCSSSCSEMNEFNAQNGHAGGLGGFAGLANSHYSTAIDEGCNGDSGYLGESSDNLMSLSEYSAGNGGNGDGGVAGAYTHERIYSACSSTLDESGAFYTTCDSSIGDGTVGQSGGGGGGGYVYHCYQNDSLELDDAWVFGGSGGSGGCGGYAGIAGGVGTSVVGMLLSPPQTGDMHLELETGFEMTLIPGLGGAGQPGQDGRYGGWRGKGYGFAQEDFLTIDHYCHKATAGGHGGGGGGGGGGAAGISGSGYGMVLVCNRFVLALEYQLGMAESMGEYSRDLLRGCGFDISNTFVSNLQERTTIEQIYHGSNGKAGASGKTLTSLAAVPDNLTKTGATGGQAGVPGASELAATRYSFVVKHDTSFVP